MEIHVCTAGDVVMPICESLRQLLGNAAGGGHSISRGCGRLLGPCHALQRLREEGGTSGVLYAH